MWKNLLQELEANWVLIEIWTSKNKMITATTTTSMTTRTLSQELASKNRCAKITTDQSRKYQSWLPPRSRLMNSENKKSFKTRWLSLVSRTWVYMEETFLDSPMWPKERTWNTGRKERTILTSQIINPCWEWIKRTSTGLRMTNCSLDSYRMSRIHKLTHLKGHTMHYQRPRRLLKKRLPWITSRITEALPNLHLKLNIDGLRCSKDIKTWRIDCSMIFQRPRTEQETLIHSLALSV